MLAVVSALEAGSCPGPGTACDHDQGRRDAPGFVDLAVIGDLMYYPVSLHLGLSYACNMACRHCFALGRKRVQSLSPDEVASILDGAARLMTMNVVMSCGEPMLYEPLHHCLRLIDERGFHCTIITNGYAVSGADIATIAALRSKIVYVSIDSPVAEEHDRNRRRRGAWTSANDTIRRLQTAGVRVAIASTIDPRDPRRAIRMISYAEKLGVHSLSLLTIRTTSQSEPIEDGSYLAGMEEVVTAALRSPMKRIQFHDPRLSRLRAVESMAGREGEIFRADNECTAGRYRISVLPNGDVTTCNLANVVLGNIRQTSLYDIWNGLRAQEVRSTPMGYGDEPCRGRSLLLPTCDPQACE